MAKAEPSSLAREVDERVAVLEAGQTELRDEIHAIGVRFDSFARDIGNKLDRMGRPQWGVVVAFATLAATIFISAGGAGFTILKMSSDHSEELRMASVLSADKLVASMFKEVETQFHGVTKELETQIANNQDINGRQDKRISDLNAFKDDMLQRVSKAEQALVDHDKYLFDQIGRNAADIRDLKDKR